VIETSDKAGQNSHYANFDFQNSLNANANVNRDINFISRNVMHWFRLIK